MNSFDIQFHLFNSKVSYICELQSDTWLLHRYWAPGCVFTMALTARNP